MPRLLRARRALLLALVAPALCHPASAAAESVSIVAQPLTVHVGDRGRLQANEVGNPSGLLFPPDSTLGDAGFFLAFPSFASPPPPAAVVGKVFGFEGDPAPADVETFFAGAQSTVQGTGTTADPFRQQTTYGVPDVALVTQTTTYVAGESSFAVRWDVRNATDSPLPFKALAGADFYVDGSDAGTAVYLDGPPRFVGSTNPETGRSVGLAELPGPVEPWSHYEVPAAGDDPAAVWGKVQAAGRTTAPTLLDVLLAAPGDNAGAVEWDRYATAPLAAGATATFGLSIRTAAPNGLRVMPSIARGQQGVAIPFTIEATDPSGAPRAAVTVRYSIAGVNEGTGTAVTDAAGEAAILHPATNAGVDAVVAFLDLNGNGAREPTEDQAAGVAVVADVTPPDCAVRVGRRRPGGSGAAPRPLVASVRCAERATITARVRLRIRGRQLRIQIPAERFVVAARRATPVRVRIPARVRTRYAGAVAVAVVAVTARDAAGNLATVRARRSVRLAS